MCFKPALTQFKLTYSKNYSVLLSFTIFILYYHSVSNIFKYTGPGALQDRNEVLFYRVILDNFKDFAPVIYTPGQCCSQSSDCLSWTCSDARCIAAVLAEPKV